MWDNVSDFMATVKDAYKKDVWETQPKYFEAWIEKGIDVKAFEQTQEEQGQDLEKINSWINKVGGSL